MQRRNRNIFFFKVNIKYIFITNGIIQVYA